MSSMYNTASTNTTGQLKSQVTYELKRFPPGETTPINYRQKENLPIFRQ